MSLVSFEKTMRPLSEWIGIGGPVVSSGVGVSVEGTVEV
jgi:hypothetical protein